MRDTNINRRSLAPNGVDRKVLMSTNTQRGRGLVLVLGGLALATGTLAAVVLSPLALPTISNLEGVNL